MLFYIVVSGLLVFVGLQVAIRLTPIKPEAWHVDPSTAIPTGKPNSYLVSDTGDQPPLRLNAAPAEIAQHLAEIALSEPRTTLVAGSVSEQWFTLQQRSCLMGYPDFISIRVTASEDGAEVTLYSRSRDGYSDMGVNKSRVLSWLDQLQVRLPSS